MAAVMLRGRVVVSAAVLWLLFFIGCLVFKAHKGGVVAVISNTSFLGLVVLTLFLLTAGVMALRRRGAG
jgi:predicted transporter